MPRSAAGGEAREGGGAGVPRRVVQLLLDAQQLVVLGDALAAGRGTGLDLTAVDRDGEVGDRGVLGLAGTVAHHRAVAGPVRQVDRVQGLGERADLVDLPSSALAAPGAMPSASRAGLVTNRSSRRS